MIAKGKKYQFQARNGYYASKSKTPLGNPAEEAKQEVQDPLFSRDETVSIPLKLEATSRHIDAASAHLTVLTHLDIRGIQFGKSPDSVATTWL